MKRSLLTTSLLTTVAAMAAVPSANAGWLTVTQSGTPVLSPCNPKPFTTPTPSTCLLTGQTLLAALGSGYIQKGTSTGNITANSTVVGTYYDRIYCIGTGTTCATSGTGANTYVLAYRFKLTNLAWNGHNSQSFEVNDTIRAVKSTVGADIAYWMGPTTGGSTTSANPDTALANGKWLEYSGHTQKGLNDTGVGTRDNTYIDFRQDVNANDPDGVSSPWSAFLLVRQVCSGGLTTGNFNVKLWEGGEEAQDHYTQWGPGNLCQ